MLKKKSCCLSLHPQFKIKEVIKKVLMKYNNINPLSTDQVEILCSLVNGNNTIVSMPTGSGKSIPIFILPIVYDELNGFELNSTAILYLSPLVALGLSISYKLDYFGIPHTLIDDSFNGSIKPNSKIIIGTPELLLSERIQKIMKKINIISIILDEVHLFHLWGFEQTSKRKKKDPFRPLMARVGELAIFNCNYGILSATLSKSSISFIKSKLLYIKNWYSVVRSPDRKNLRFFLYTTKSIEEVYNVIIKDIEYEGGLKKDESILINVHSMEIGFEIYTLVKEFLQGKDLVLIDKNLPNISSNRKIAFVNSLISSERKKEIVEDLTSEIPKIKIVISTPCMGTGVDMKVRKIFSIGLPTDEASFLQTAGRAGRNGNEISDVIFFKSSKFNRIPSNSIIRELFNVKCLRETSTKWFTDDFEKVEESHLCCSACMIICVSESNCSKCKNLLHKYNPSSFNYSKSDKEEIIYELNETFGKIKIGKLNPRYVSTDEFMNSVVEMEPRVDNSFKLVETFNINQEVAELTYNWILKVRVKFEREVYFDPLIHEDPFDNESESESENDNTDNESILSEYEIEED